MEKNNNRSLNNHGASLQLRSKEVSEVMGNIPSSLGVWGTIIIFLLFTLSILLIFNIHCIQKISSKVTITDRQISMKHKTVSQHYFLQVIVPVIENNKIKAGQKIALSFHAGNNYFNKLNDVSFSVDGIAVNKNNCVMSLVGNSDVIEKTMLYNPALLNRVQSCEVVLDGTVFEKVFGSLF